MATAAEAERLLTEWAAGNGARDGIIRTALEAGISKHRIHVLTGISRSTIDRALAREHDMTATLPSWTDYTVTVGAEYAAYLEDSGRALGGLRIVDLGDGRAALDAGAVEQLKGQPEDADGCISHDDDGLRMWLQGSPFQVSPADE